MKGPDLNLNAKLKNNWRNILGWVLIGIGAVAIFAGWYGVSGDPNVARQLSYLASGGLGGLATAVVGVGLLIAGDVRSERERLGRIESGLADVRSLLRDNLDVTTPSDARSQSI